MKILFLIPVITVGFSFTPHVSAYTVIAAKDTSGINHKTDGNTGEWPDEKFGKDEITGIRYAIDNDNHVLFISMRIADPNVQQKVMTQGMDLYIDTKGKKKEKCGIGFPFIKENESVAGTATMKLFGFKDMETDEQPIQQEGAANVALTWDAANVIHVEYSIPLNMLEEPASALHQKNISFGWKIKEAATLTESNTATRPGTTTSRIVAVPSGTRPSSPRVNPPISNNSTPEIKGQSFWSKFTITL